MTELSDYIEHMPKKRRDDIDWCSPPWDGAQAALAWLGWAPAVTRARPTVPMSPSDAKVLCDQMMRRFVAQSGELTWSSHMLETAVDSVTWGLGGPPEPLLRSAWELLKKMELSRNTYEFCRAIGVTIRTRGKEYHSWDLTWMIGHASPSQACLRYWTLAVKPELFDNGVEEVTMGILKPYPFPF